MIQARSGIQEAGAQLRDRLQEAERALLAARSVDLHPLRDDIADYCRQLTSADRTTARRHLAMAQDLLEALERIESALVASQGPGSQSPIPMATTDREK